MSSNFPRAILGAFVLWASLAPNQVDANSLVSEKKNKDGSVVTLSRKFCEDSSTCFKVSVGDSTLLVPDKRGEAKGPAAPGARLLDIDQDGYFDLDNRGLCGAGPNCEHDLYRYDPKAQKFYHFYTGGYSEMAIEDGYLIAQGRSSAAKWETQIYKISSSHDVLEHDDTDIRVVVTVEPNGKPSECKLYYSKISVPKPPEKRWLKYCSRFGKDFLQKQTSPLNHP
jgi:hypothetical protein